MSQTILEHLEKALQSLESALNRSPLDDLMRDGAIQRFEYCVELSWKTSKKLLDQNGMLVTTPKETYRKLANIGWIQDAQPWLEFIEARNKTSHMYKEDVANAIFAVLPQFLIEARKLLVSLKQVK